MGSKVMDKYPLIGVSIIAVVLLVLGSLTNVVGYQSVKSTAMSGSPLFSVRTKKAINQENRNILTSDYLGKGIESNLLFPVRENGTGTLQQFIERIQTMDENEFSRFQSLVVSRLSEDKSNKNIDSIQVLSLLKQIRSDKKALLITQFANIDNDMEFFTENCPETSRIGQGCFIVVLLFLILIVISSVTSRFSVVFTCQQSICGGIRCFKL